MTKDSILKLLREIAEVEGGDVSMRRFIAVSGIKEKQILGVHWPTWNDAKREAGLETQAFARERLQDDSLIPAIARLMSSLGRWPTENELRLAKKQDLNRPGFSRHWRASQNIASRSLPVTDLCCNCGA